MNRVLFTFYNYEKNILIIVDSLHVIIDDGGTCRETSRIESG